MATNPSMNALLLEQRLDELDQTVKEAKALVSLIDYVTYRVAALALAVSFHPENQNLCTQALQIAKDRLELLTSAYGMDKDDLLIELGKIQRGGGADLEVVKDTKPLTLEDGRL